MASRRFLPRLLIVTAFCFVASCARRQKGPDRSSASWVRYSRLRVLLKGAQDFRHVEYGHELNASHSNVPSLRQRIVFAWQLLRGAVLPAQEQAPLSADDLADLATRIRGRKNTLRFRRQFFGPNGRQISPWHDIPLKDSVDGIYLMVTEIPKMTRAKMEILTKETSNPIAQDVDKTGRLRQYHGPIYWNYGYLPQTWEDPTALHPDLDVYGDNDPVDVVEIGSRQHAQGEVVAIKVLGALAMIDDGELDWKIIAVAQDDDLAKEMHDIADVEKKMPWVVSGIREWFRWYKAPDGKPLNSFGFGEAAVGKKEAMAVIEETHEAWKRLRTGSVETNLWIGSTP